MKLTYRYLKKILGHYHFLIAVVNTDFHCIPCKCWLFYMIMIEYPILQSIPNEWCNFTVSFFHWNLTPCIWRYIANNAISSVSPSLYFSLQCSFWKEKMFLINFVFYNLLLPESCEQVSLPLDLMIPTGELPTIDANTQSWKAFLL